MAAASATSRVLGVGIIGAGVIGQRLARAVAEVGTTLAVRAVCDVNVPAAEALAKSCGDDVTVTSDFKALIADSNVDIIYIGVPPALHKTMAIAALDTGKHVICEKPLALSAADADAMAAAAKAAQGLSTVNLPFRHMSPVWAMQEAVARDGSGFVGTPRRVDIRFRFPLWPRAWQIAPWVGQKAQGGPLREVGTHFYFLMGELFGGITRMRATLEFPDAPADAPGGGPCEVSAVGQFTTATGVPGTLDLLTGVAGDEQVVCTVYGTKGTVTLTGWSELTGQRIGTAGRVVSESGSYEGKKGAGAGVGAGAGAGAEDDGKVVLLSGRDGMTASPEALLLRRLAAGAATATDGADADGSTRSLVSFQQAADAQRVLDAILASNGEWVDIRGYA